MLQGLPELRLHGLPDVEARALLAAPTLGQLDERVRDRIIAEAHGNPLALLELPRGLLSTGLTGAFGVPDGSAPPAHVEASFHERVAQLPEATQLLLLVGAAEPLGDTALLWRAAEELGIPVEALAPATAADLIKVGTRVTFRHPLLRSAIYSGASAKLDAPSTRLLPTPPIRKSTRTGSLGTVAQATLAPDELVALELERAADRARARGGLGAAAAFLERSADLTPDPGAPGRASAGRGRAQAGSGSVRRGAAAGPRRSRRSPRWTATRPGRTAAGADRVGPAGRSTRRPCCSPRPDNSNHMTLRWPTRRTWKRSPLHSRRGTGRCCADMARAISDAPPAQHPRPAELLVTGWARLFADGFPAGTDILRQALVAFQNEPLSTTVEIQGLWFASGVAKSLWDDEQLARRRAALRAVDARRGRSRQPCREHSTHMLEFLVEVGCVLRRRRPRRRVADDRRCDGHHLASADIDAPWTLAAWRNDPGISERLDARLRDARRRDDGWMIVHFGSRTGAAQQQPRSQRRSDGRSPDRPRPPCVRGHGASTDRADRGRLSRRQPPGSRQPRWKELAERTRLSGTDWALGVEAPSPRAAA